MFIAVVFLIIGSFLLGLGTGGRGSKKETISGWGTAMILAGAIFAYLGNHWKGLGIYFVASFVLIAIFTRMAEHRVSK
jgi:hypothetical protein